MYCTDYIGKTRRKLGKIVFFFLLIGIIIAMAYQIIFSILKIQRFPTGSSLDTQRAETNLNLSLSICLDLNQFSNIRFKGLKSLTGVFRRENEDAPWVKSQENEPRIFIWTIDKEVHHCLVFEFPTVEVKLTHKFNEFLSTSVYVHESGLLTAGNSIKLDGNILYNNNILMLDVQQIQKIEDANVCTNSNEYDVCREDLISEEFNSSQGCLYYDMRCSLKNK